MAGARRCTAEQRKPLRLSNDKNLEGLIRRERAGWRIEIREPPANERTD